jgi:hypothetical protein
MKSPIFLYFYLFCFVKSIMIDRYSRFLKNKSIYSIFNDIINQKLKKPIILNGVKTPLKKDFCKIISELNDITFKEYRFDSFMTELPYVNNKNSLLYINDFLVGHGRILNHYEENILLNLNKNSNLIVLNTDNINTIPFKDSNIIRHFPIIQFPEINKREIIQFIYDTITINDYDEDLYNLNWINYNIEKLDFEKINILAFELNSLYKKNKDFKLLNNNVNNIIDSLYNLNDFELNVN